MGKHNFTDTMERGKLLAQRALNRGQHTGKAAKGWVRARPHHTPEKGSWDRLLTETRTRWNHAAGSALQDYQWSVNPSRADVEAYFANGGTL